MLISATARAGRTESPEEIQHLAARADLDAVADAAVLHRVAGSVLRGLEGVDVPPRVSERLRVIRTASALRHLHHTAVLAEIGQLFDAAGVDWVVMKGPMLAARLYPDTGDRTYGDLDLLVGRQHYADAMTILERAGFEHEIHDWALSEEMLNGEVSMARGPITVDLHWHLHYSHQDRRPFTFVPEQMIARRRVTELSGMSAGTLDPEDNLITIAFHAARSDGHRLIWLKDIERAIALDPPDFDEVIRRARQGRCGPSVGLMLRRARWLLGAEVPDGVVESLVPGLLVWTDRIVCAVVHPIQLDERPTSTRCFTRSLRSSVPATLTDVPLRFARRLARRLNPPRPNETDDPGEKARYLDAVANALD